MISILDFLVPLGVKKTSKKTTTNVVIAYGCMKICPIWVRGGECR
jgi:hypothetical protein